MSTIVYNDAKSHNVTVDWEKGNLSIEGSENELNKSNFFKTGKFYHKMLKGDISEEDFIEKAALGAGVSNTGDKLVGIEFASIIASRVYDESLVMSVFPKIQWRNSYKFSLPYESTAVWDVQASTPPATLTEDNSGVFATLDFTSKRVGGFAYVDPILEQENPALMPFMAKRIGDDIADYVDTQVLTAANSGFTDCFVDDWDESTGTTLAATIDGNSQPVSIDLIDKAATEVEANGGEPNLVIMAPKTFAVIKRDENIELVQRKGYAVGRSPVATLDGMDIYLSRKITEDASNKHDAVVMDREAMLVGIRQDLQIARGKDIERDADVIAGNMRMDVPGLLHPKHAAGIKDLLDYDG